MFPEFLDEELRLGETECLAQTIRVGLKPEYGCVALVKPFFHHAIFLSIKMKGLD